MKRTIIVFLSLICVFNYVNAQSSKTFDCGLFSLEYPICYNFSPIKNAPHMVLKLESKNSYLSVSYWDKGFEPGTDIWDDVFVDMYNDLPVENGERLSVTRETLHTKGGKVKCIKIMSNMRQKVHNQAANFKMLSYIIINNEYLFVFNFCDIGQYKPGEKTTKCDNLMKGLRFKSVSLPQVDFKSDLLETVKILNAQCPIQADECTIFKQVMLVGETIMINTFIPTECYEFVDFDGFKLTLTQNLSSALEKSFVIYLKKEGYVFTYMVYDENQRYKKRITITADDILAYY
ncbi:MAG: hypothetical protein ACI4A8_06075 [Muribaculaceae bacterium]